MLAVVVHAGHRIGGRVLKNKLAVAIAIGAFIALFFFKVPFPLIIVAAAMVGYVGNRIRPDLVVSISRDEKDSKGTVDAILSDGVPEHVRPSFARAITHHSVLRCPLVRPHPRACDDVRSVPPVHTDGIVF